MCMAEAAPVKADAPKDAAPKAEVKAEAPKEKPAAKVEAMVKANAQTLRSQIWDKIKYVFSGKWLPSWGKKVAKK